MGFTSTNIGIYISANDKDIAAWFNLLTRNHIGRSKWVCGLLAAYALGQPLRIGIIDKKAPLINDPDNPSDTVSTQGPFKYGWHIRGPNKEYVIGSVINISIRNDEIKDVLDEAWTNGHMLSTFIKSLIRKNLKSGDREVAPKVDDLNRVWSEYLVSVNAQATKRKKANQVAVEVPNKPAKADSGWVTEEVHVETGKAGRDKPAAVLKPTKPKSDRAFTFSEDNADGTSAHVAAKPAQPVPSPPVKKPASPPTSTLGKNPLLSQI